MSRFFSELLASIGFTYPWFALGEIQQVRIESIASASPVAKAIDVLISQDLQPSP
jgi:hypothetical protein